MDKETVESTKNNKLAPITIVVVLLGVIGFLVFSNIAPSTPYSLEDVSKHATKADCWTTINGKVYDVTKFISNHKGGDKILAVCGIDGTDLFTGKSPMGRIHSKVAVKLLSKMQIGKVQ